MRISVIIPVYNAERTLSACVQSVLSQTTLPEEILLADDGSTDRSTEIAEEICKENERVRLLRLAHSGVSGARNSALAEAGGEWILLLDADDLLTDGALDTLAEGAEGDADAVCGDILSGKERARAKTGGKEQLDRAEIMDRALADPTSLLTIHGWMFRRSVCEGKTFHPRLKLGEDSEWVLRVLADCRKVVLVHRPVYRYTLSADSVIHRWQPGKSEAYLKMLDAVGKTDTRKEKNWPLFALTTLLLMLTHDTFHPANPSGRKAQLRELKRLRELPVMREAFREADLSGLPVEKRMTLWCVKHGLYRLVKAAVRTRQRQNARKV